MHRDASLVIEKLPHLRHVIFLGEGATPGGTSWQQFMCLGEALRYTSEDRICTPVPFYHCFGCVMANLAALTHAAAVIVPAESFDPEATLRAVEMHRCTSIYGVPTMFIAMLGHACFDQVRLESLRTGIMAGSPCPIEVMRDVIHRMHVREVAICYGMTETSPVSFQSAVDDPIEARV